MKLMTVKQLMKKSKTALIRRITKSLRSMPKKKLAVLCYQISKSKLPRLRTTKRKASPRWVSEARKQYPLLFPRMNKTVKALPKRKTKRKFSKKQLAAQRLFAKRAKAGTLRKRRR